MRNTSSLRDCRLDTARGFLLVIMTIDHLGLITHKITYESFGFVGAAEFFVFLSGFLFFEVYYKYASDFRQVLHKTLRRALFVYKYYACISIVISITPFFIPVYYGYFERWIGNFYSNPIKYIIGEILLIHVPNQVAILQLYVILIIMSPIALILIKQGKIFIVITTSLLLYKAGHIFNIYDTIFFSLSLKPPFHNPFCWQLVWIFGLHASRYKISLMKLFDNRYMIIPLIVCLFFFGLRHNLYAIKAITPQYTDVRNLGELRILNFIALTWVFSKIFTLFKKNSGIYFLYLLGRNSIQVFSFQILIMYLTIPLNWRIVALNSPAVLVLYEATIILFLAIPAFLTEKLKKIT